MISRSISVHHEEWPLKEPFKISRGVKTAAHVIVVEINSGAFCGRGEAVPYTHYDETTDSVILQIERVAHTIENNITPEQLQELLPAGSARNAVDCALWDILSRCKDLPPWKLLQLPPPGRIKTAVTIGLDSTAAMAKKALSYKDFPLLKVKLDNRDIKDKISAIRQQAPQPKIIIDPNESWTMDILRELDDFLDRMNISLLEQPLAAGQDGALKDFQGKIPICADESCHTRKDLEGLKGKYQVINIKLDKTGGLTEAVQLKKEAEAMGFEIMVGCMVSTSLAMAPAMLLASDVAFVDLDGPIWMKNDRKHGLNIIQGQIEGFSPELWGGK